MLIYFIFLRGYVFYTYCIKHTLYMLTLGVEPRIPVYKTDVITVSLCELIVEKIGRDHRVS